MVEVHDGKLAELAEALAELDALSEAAADAQKALLEAAINAIEIMTKRSLACHRATKLLHECRTQKS